MWRTMEDAAILSAIFDDDEDDKEREGEDSGKDLVVASDSHWE